MEVIKNYRQLSGKKGAIIFRQFLIELPKILRSFPIEKQLNTDIGVLIARANIFQSLLIKYFISAADFDNLVIHLPVEKK
jgi:hypothetical protein